MFKNTKVILPVLAAGMLAFQACNKLGGNSFKKTETGLEYQLFAKNKDGKYEAKEAPSATDTTKLNKEGQILRVHMRFDGQLEKGSKDTTLTNSFTSLPIYLPITKPSFKGSVEEAFAMLAPGDSGVFKVNADSTFLKTFKQPSIPPRFKKGGTFTFYLKAEKVMSQQEAMMDQQTEMMAFMAKQNKIDEGVIEKYLKENKFSMQPQKTSSGLYYVITKEGTGPKPEAGKMVSVQYTGTTLDGKEFDSSYKNPQLGGKPIEFPIGQGAVIRGWDEGIALLNKGTKATLIIPSTMAYGPQEQPKIPANSVLRFDVELVDIKDMPQQQMMQPGLQQQPQ
ncbi:FKBP-type peptidyl-prolyl cis-trans isomerase [Adhaeribacter aquaticus]|uniref:FKBP-type peptidyl-prolyl cis-trans isomerase n=1 Tax=Adhaeribacter aquaticus TaxID=299567 RepID=UPI0004219137|nr:FKBP-type peptidyl-prolyl cis-trans isomerase [Adhaeribacter aquaticus]